MRTALILLALFICLAVPIVMLRYILPSPEYSDLICLPFVISIAVSTVICIFKAQNRSDRNGLLFVVGIVIAAIHLSILHQKGLHSYYWRGIASVALGVVSALAISHLILEATPRAAGINTSTGGETG